MTDKEKKLRILRLLKSEVLQAQERYLNAKADEASALAYKEHWNQLHPDDGVGGFSQNPMNYRVIESHQIKVSRTQTEYENSQSVYNYALENLVGD